MTVVNFKNAEVSAKDTALQGTTGKVTSKTIQMGLFGNVENADWAAQRYLKEEAYPLASGSFPANRRVFRLQPGDGFVLNYAPYKIYNKICRVGAIEEENPESERVIVHFVEDIWYIGSDLIGTGIKGTGPVRDLSISPLTYVAVGEAPYVLSEGKIQVIPLASRGTQIATGYQFYSSSDGASYIQMGLCSKYQPMGSLLAAYSRDTFEIDDEVGLDIEFDGLDVAMIESVSRNDLFTGVNTAIIGRAENQEIISFQTITPVGGDEYRLTGIVRGRWDTEKKNHEIGEPFWFVDINQFVAFEDASTLIPGVTRYFKLNPYNSRNIADLSQAEEVSLHIEGRAKKPYKPANFQCNDQMFRASYTTDIVLEWSPRIRGGFAGYHSASTILDAATTWEGLFEVEIFVGGEKIRTETAIDNYTWTYTEAANLSDNGSLPSLLLFKLRNYIEMDGVRYDSPDALLRVYNSTGTDFGSPTTTSTTTTSSSSSTTTTIPV